MPFIGWFTKELGFFFVNFTKVQRHWGAIFAINSYHVIYQLLGLKINIQFSGKAGELAQLQLWKAGWLQW